MKRTIIKIDEQRCNGCEACVKGCHEGVLQMINGKAVMISDLYCDGLGACIGDCPVGAITLEEREAEPYNEKLVMERLIPKGEEVIIAHLNHLKEHGETGLMSEALDYLKQKGLEMAYPEKEQENPLQCGCPSSMMRIFGKPSPTGRTHIINQESYTPVSELRQFPVQLHLLNPQAGFLQNADLLLAADCTAFAYGNFHLHFLKDRRLAIACPKLDSHTENYVRKLTEMIDGSALCSLTVLIMEVPCCRGLVRVAEMAREQAVRKIPLNVVVISVQGEVVSEKQI